MKSKAILASTSSITQTWNDEITVLLIEHISIRFQAGVMMHMFI
jgi:hypothetical protein